MNIQTAKLFMNGNNQAVLLPKGFYFDSTEVYIRQQGTEVILSAKPKSWEDYFAHARKAPEEFMAKVDDEMAQTRELF